MAIISSTTVKPRSAYAPSRSVKGRSSRSCLLSDTKASPGLNAGGAFEASGAGLWNQLSSFQRYDVVLLDPLAFMGNNKKLTPEQLQKLFMETKTTTVLVSR